MSVPYVYYYAFCNFTKQHRLFDRLLECCCQPCRQQQTTDACCKYITRNMLKCSKSITYVNSASSAQQH